MWHNSNGFKRFIIIAHLFFLCKSFLTNFKNFFQESLIMNKLVLIDGNSILYRAFYATPYFTTSKGVQTNAVYGFINMLVKIINEVEPDYMLVAFDRKEPTYRHLMYDGYKAARKPMPEELVGQLPLIRKALDVLKIKTLDIAGLEADDIIGSAAKQLDAQAIVITGDKDSFQLIDQATQVYFTRKGISNLEVYDAENFLEKTGIQPSQVVDLKACMGDQSDNIPGMPGIGEKRAMYLLNRFGTLDNIYANIEEIPVSFKEKVLAGKESAYMSQKLATINTAADLGIKLKDLTFKFPFPYEARLFFSELEFNNLLKKNYFAKPSKWQKIKAASTEKAQKAESIKREILNTIDSDCAFFASEKIAMHISDKIYLSDGETEFEVNIKEDFFSSGMDFGDALEALKPLFKAESGKKFIVYDKKKLKHYLKSFGYDFQVDCEDVMLEKYVVDYTQKELDCIGAIEHAGLDITAPAYSLFKLHEKYVKMLEEEGAFDLYNKIELPLCDVLYEMENAGFKIETQALEAASVSYRERINALNEQITQLAGKKFNVNSPRQLGEVLFEDLGLRHGKKTKTGYSTNAEVLDEMIDDHPIIPLILQYRQLQKLASTYIDGFKPLIDKNTGLIHTVFNQTVTSTGRLSSKEPNLQNIPVRDDEGREIRKFFIPRAKDRVIVDADYSQIELRLLAHYSGCQKLIDAFNSDEDIHAITASQVFGVQLDQVTPDQRRSAKAVNFGIIYGISEYGLAKNLRVYPKVAASYIKTYFEMYPSVKEYMNANVEFAKEKGYVCTAFGRRRTIPEIHSPNYNVRMFGERAAMNMPLQGTAADIIKIAMNNVYERLKKEAPEAILILQVHDELIVDCPETRAEKVKNILRDEMQNAVKLSVPLTVNVACAKNWYEAK